MKFGRVAVLPYIAIALLTAFASAGCNNAESKQPPPPPLPVKTKTIDLEPVPRADEYVATVKSRRSANIQPQVDGALTQILVKSGDHVRAGQPLMTIDPVKQQAVVDQQRSTEAQKKAVLDYNEIDLQRQKKLYEEGVASKQAYDLAQQAYDNSKADFEAAKSARVTQERELAYYTLRSPFAGIVGDIPVHVGDYVSPQTLLTTLDEKTELEAYIYVPSERSANIRMGLPVEIISNTGELIEKTNIYFISEQVDSGTQGILVKAPIHTSLDRFRALQLVKARVIWSTAPAPTVPILAVTRIGGQSFVYLAVAEGSDTLAKQRAVTLGDTIGNDYAVLGGLKPGDRVIVSGTQFLIDGAPVQPIS